MIIPVKKCVWGPINNIADLKKYIAKSGQFFGQDLSGPACAFNPTYPCDQTLYQYMGWGLHKGLDIPCGEGTEIYASHDGIVWRTSETVSQGLGIVLESLDEEFQTVYWHNKQNLVKVGDNVKEGDLIAYSDNTGFSKGNHLHFEIKKWNGSQYVPIDPMPLLEDMKFELRKAVGSSEVWLVRDGKKSHVYNAQALLMVADFTDIKEITQDELNLIPDSGFELASLTKE